MEKADLPRTMTHAEQKEVFQEHPDYKKIWDKWKLKTITAKDAGTDVDIIIVGISVDGELLAKLKYPRNETNLKGWGAKVLDEEEFILKKYKETHARYAYDFNLVDDGN